MTKSFFGLIGALIIATVVAVGLSSFLNPPVYVAENLTKNPVPSGVSGYDPAQEIPHVPKTDAKNQFWTQISGDANDTCTNPKFTGNVTLTGWMVTEEAYFGGMMDFLKVPHPEFQKLPWDLLNAGAMAKALATSNEPVTLVVDDPTSNILLTKLKAANPSNPVTFTATEFSHYCEGWGVVKIK